MENCKELMKNRKREAGLRGDIACEKLTQIKT